MGLLSNKSYTSYTWKQNFLEHTHRHFQIDLSKMKLTYYGVKVGICKIEQLSIEKEFELKSENAKPKPEDILDGTTPENDFLEVYDIVLAGVVCE